MKKIMTLGLALTLVAAMAVTASAKQSYEAANATPVIDGQKDDAYTVATEIVLDHELAAMADSGFATGLAYTAWDNDNLYVFIEVTDPVISTEKAEAVWQSDSIEAYLDCLNEEGNLITDVDAGQFTAGYLYIDDNLEVTGDNWGGGGLHLDVVKEKGKAHFIITDKGYNCEMVIPWGDEFKPAVGAQVGFTVAICDDADNAPGREYQVFPDDDLTNAWQETTNYATLTLTDKTYVAPVEEVPAEEVPAEGGEETPVAPTTADAGIVAAAALMAAAAGVVLSKKH